MFRRRPPEPPPPPPQPEWERRFDDAATLIRSRPQPAWVEERLGLLHQSLVAADETARRLGSTVEQLDADATASDLKVALRERERALSNDAAADLDRRVDTLRQRYDAVNEMLNRRDTIDRQMLNTVADVELLAAQSLRSATGTTDSRLTLDGQTELQPEDRLDEHFKRLETDLQALELARREVDSL